MASKFRHAARPIPFSPGNSLALLVTFKDLNDETGLPEEIITGAATAFIAESSDPDAEAADPDLEVDATYTAEGWLVKFPASVMTFELLDALFGASSAPCPWLIVTHDSGQRAVAELLYSKKRVARTELS